MTRDLVAKHAVLLHWMTLQFVAAVWMVSDFQQHPRSGLRQDDQTVCFRVGPSFRHRVYLFRLLNGSSVGAGGVAAVVDPSRWNGCRLKS